MAKRDIVVIGASAGGIEALRHVLGGVPPEFRGVVLVVLHIAPGAGTALPEILDRAGPLTATAGVDGEPLAPGHVYVAPADHHLVISTDHIHVVPGPRENGHRPAADPLFRSAARYHGTRVVGVVLSGTLSDGTAGLDAVRKQGGIAVVQDPDDALYDGMPTNALEWVGADFVLPAVEIGPLVGRLATEDVPDDPPDPSETMVREVARMEGNARALDDDHPGTPSPWPCPDCNGVLWQIDDGRALRFRCRIGHAWGAESLLAQQGTEVDVALWVALRALEDRAALSRTLAERATSRGHRISARRYGSDADTMARSIDTLRRLLESGAGAQLSERERG